MKRYTGTISTGIRTPIVKAGDNLADIVYDSVVKAVDENNIKINDKDVVCITESLLARSQNNYATIEQIAKDVSNKFESDEIAVVFPILSRNRFSVMLRAFAKTGKKLHILLSFPQDEVGNHIMDERKLYGSNVNPYTDVLEEDEFRELFGEYKHEFTGIDYIKLYKEIAPNSEIHLTNDATNALKYTDSVIVASIHTREFIKEQLKDKGAKAVYGLDEIMTESVDGSGYNSDYGLLGSNLSDENRVKLFPRDGQGFVEDLQQRFNEKYGKNLEVMVYGDGAFKDPVGKIWELADPVVSPFHTKGLVGTPNEIKIKYVADNELKDLSDEKLNEMMIKKIKEKKKDLKGTNETLGTTPRRITDLLGSLADLTSGSGDKGTPVILIQGYFDNYSND
ncbi:MAG: coenzyme F420-0:L-glutamate ligase [Tissierellia bacterium]|nr:coenzyme F420-0:L-glutamate ligase [Tissierellia bacterium]